MDTILGLFAFMGTAVFAISGALLGLRKEMDVVGVSFVATVTGVGGGTIRDLLLGDTPVGWVTNPTDIAICIICAVIVCFLNKPLTGQRLQALLYADAAGLALFAVLGTAKAEALGAHPLVAILFGAMSATFGGVIRDVLCGEKPVLFNKEIYISAALLGGLVFMVIPQGAGFEWRAGAALLAALALRLAAMRFQWALKFPRYGA